jgi:seryl-tRNA synthetase
MPDGAESDSLEKSESDSAKADEGKSKKLLEDLVKERKKRQETEAELKAIKDAEDLKKGNYEKLIGDLKAENEGLKTVAAEVETYKEKLTAIEKQRREELLNQLPVNSDHRKFAETLSLEQLPTYVSLNKATIEPDGGSGGKVKTDFSKVQTFDDLKKLGFKAMEQYKQENPDKYKQLLNAKTRLR